MFVRTDKDIKYYFGGGGYLFIKEVTSGGPAGYHSSERNLGKVVAMNKNICKLCDGFYIDDGSKQFKKDNIFEKVSEQNGAVLFIVPSFLEEGGVEGGKGGFF